ncbi:VOC family protein [Mycolicibacterium sp.]|uniref:VOC family protein n=1 Tax=Mycolicibacterium sp. TaxID=2320850 RepID=UPI0037C96D9F
MNLSLLVIYVPEPSLNRAAQFYAAVLDAEPVREHHGGGPVHWSVTSAGTGLAVEMYPMGSGLPTRSRFEFVGDAEAAVQRLIDRAFALPERTRDGRGFWCHDPIGNTVVLLP